MESITIIGFDPASTKNLGWSVMEYEPSKDKVKVVRCVSGTLTLKTFDERWRSLGPMSEWIDEFLQKESPDIVILEQTNSFRPSKKAGGGFVTGQVSHCIGLLLATCSRLDLDVGFVYPSHCKKVLTGDGRAKKPKVKKGVDKALKLLGVPPIKFDSDHASDATGNILVWLADTDVLEIPEEKE